MHRLTDKPFTAYIGIDWADSKQDACLQAAGSEQREFTCFSHQVDRIEAWAHSMHQRFGGPIAIVLELSKGPIVSCMEVFLEKMQQVLPVLGIEAFVPAVSKEQRDTQRELLTCKIKNISASGLGFGGGVMPVPRPGERRTLRSRDGRFCVPPWTPEQVAGVRIHAATKSRPP